MLSDDFSTIAKFDNFDLPTGIELINDDTDETQENIDDKLETDIQTEPVLQDEFHTDDEPGPREDDNWNDDLHRQQVADQRRQALQEIEEVAVEASTEASDPDGDPENDSDDNDSRDSGRNDKNEFDFKFSHLPER